VALAVGASEFGLVLLLTILVVVPVAAVAFARSGEALRNLGKGRFAIDRDDDASGNTRPGEAADSEVVRAEEVRQMLVAADFRSQARGDGRVDVENEIERLMGEVEPDAEPPTASGPGESSSKEARLREEIRQLVVANNERRTRRGEEPLDVEEEVENRLREWS
jgi:hypothetical protein